MQPYTEEAIIDKCKRIKIPKNREAQFQGLQRALSKPALTEDEKKAYLIGTFRAIAFDVIGLLENRHADYREIDEIIKKII